MQRRSEQYTGLAIAFHWTTALLILAMLGVGYWMVDAVKVPATRADAMTAYELHKATGLVILVLTLARLMYRYTHRPPQLPPMMAWQRRVAAGTHMGLYVLLLLIPLVGWTMVSMSPFSGPATSVFGFFEWPHIGWLHESASREQLFPMARTAHKVLAYGLLGVVLLHVLAALKHHLLDQDDVLTRILPMRRSQAVPVDRLA